MSRKKKDPKRLLRFVGTDVEVPVSRVTAVKVEKNFFHMDQLKDGNWRITYNGNMFDTLKEIECIEIVREDD
jgi:hypothetical protein